MSFFLEPLTLESLALHLAGAADGFGGLAGAAFRRLFVMAAQLHLAKDPFALHLLFERFQRLVDVVVAYQNLHLAAFSCSVAPLRGSGRRKGFAGWLPVPEAARYTTGAREGKTFRAWVRSVDFVPS